MTSLREIAHADSQMAYHLWVLVFPIVWATLAEKKDQQVQLAKPIIQLLSKEHHSKQTHHRPNVVQVVALAFAMHLADGDHSTHQACCLAVVYLMHLLPAVPQHIFAASLLYISWIFFLCCIVMNASAMLV